jgi:hypothetical protein
MARGMWDYQMFRQREIPATRHQSHQMRFDEPTDSHTGMRRAITPPHCRELLKLARPLRGPRQHILPHNLLLPHILLQVPEGLVGTGFAACG